MQFPLHTIEQLKPLIQGFRKRAGLTQADMAEKLGITQQSYAQMESNLGTTNVERLYTVLRLLNVEIKFSPSDQVAVDSTASHHQPSAPAKKPGKPKARQAVARSTNIGPQAIQQPDKTKW